MIQKRIKANSAQDAADKAAKGKIFEEEGFEIIVIQAL